MYYFSFVYKWCGIFIIENPIRFAQEAGMHVHENGKLGISVIRIKIPRGLACKLEAITNEPSDPLSHQDGHYFRIFEGNCFCNTLSVLF